MLLRFIRGSGLVPTVGDDPADDGPSGLAEPGGQMLAHTVASLPHGVHRLQELVNAIDSHGCLGLFGVQGRFICEYVAINEDILGESLDRDRRFFLLTEAVPIRGTLY